MNENSRKCLLKWFERLEWYGVTNVLPDSLYLRLAYWLRIGQCLHLGNPQTFNEKLQWLKLNDRKPIYPTLVDKYEVKNYVASIIGDQYIIPTLGIWNDFDDIDFDALPDQFVLKCTHDSGGLVICKDKSQLDKIAAKKKINKSLKRNYYYHGREWPYKDVKPRILAEKYMEDHSTSELRDYKFFCFGGTAKCYKVDFDRFISHKANYFTPDGELIELGEEVCPPDFDKVIRAPENLDKMKEFAEKLSATLPFLRADFYDVDGKVYFGELTFYPASGFGKFIFDGNDELLGSWIKLPEMVGGGYCLIYRDVLCVLDVSAKTGQSNTQDRVLNDYKFFCFTGEVRCLYVSDSIHHKIQFYDDEFQALDIERYDYTKFETLPTKPEHFEEMKMLARQLSKDIPHVRVDFYEINGRIYFGEMTFYTGSGFIPFKDRKWDELLGSWVQLPIATEGKKTT